MQKQSCCYSIYNCRQSCNMLSLLQLLLLFQITPSIYKGDKTGKAANAAFLFIYEAGYPLILPASLSRPVLRWRDCFTSLLPNR